MRKRINSERDAERDRLQALAAVASSSQAFRPAREVLLRVEAVPTIMVGVDWATHVGGQPIRRVQLVHGKSNHGKTIYSIGIGVSFLKRGHFFKLYDVERTTPITWIERMFNQFSDHVGFSAMKPKTYEDFRADWREWATRIGNAKAKGILPKDVAGVAVVDCVNKLTPRDFFDKLNADLKKQIDTAADEASAKKKGSRVNKKTTDERDGAGGRGGQIRAALNAAFLDEAIPLVDDTGTALVLIAREREDPNASMQDRMAGRGYTIRGGSSLIYDASLRTRVERAGWIYKGGKYDESNKDNEIYGERLRVRFAKTKIAGKDAREEIGYFHTSNGVFVPVGFDRARDLIDLGCEHDVVRLKGSSYSFHGKNIGNGIDRSVKNLTASPEIMDAIERELRAKMPNENNEESDED